MQRFGRRSATGVAVLVGTLLAGGVALAAGPWLVAGTGAGVSGSTSLDAPTVASAAG
ncbi:MAG: hypothetical protein QOJ92_2034, partial [Frankiales bacterium]|nr:hypothetical protein [Frankiales bacterium]